MRDQLQSVLDTLRQRNGLYVASPSNTYHYIWIRDICYMALTELTHDNGRYEQTYHSLLDILRKYEWKLVYHSEHKPVYPYQYIHPRYTVDSLEEVHEPWGNAQNDAIGALLFGIGQGLQVEKDMLRDETDRRIVSLLIEYLSTVEYWHDEDNGMWEENCEVHASSVGACVAGLLALKPFFDVPFELIQNGLSALYQLLPRESVTKDCDLALLSLIYPYRLLPEAIANIVIDNVETKLLRPLGVIRYQNDKYYQDNGREAEWCMGLPWLGLCHAAVGHLDTAHSYLKHTLGVMTEHMEIPELYLAKEQVPNENTPLGWAHAMWVLLFDTLHVAPNTIEQLVGHN